MPNVMQTKTRQWKAQPSDLSGVSGLKLAVNMEVGAADKILDLSGNNRDGTIEPGAIPRRGFELDSIRTFASTGSVNFGDILDNDGADAVSFNIVFRVENGTINDFIFSKYGASGTGAGFRLFINGTGQLTFRLANDLSNYIDAVTSDTFNDGVIHTCSITYDGSKTAEGIAIMVDGSERTVTYQNTGTFTDSSNSEPFRLSGRGEPVNLPLNGEIYDFQAYSRVISDSEKEAYHNRFAKIVLFQDFFDDEATDGSVTRPREWIINSGTVSIQTDTTGDFLQCDSNAILNYPIDLSHFIGHGYLKQVTGDLSDDSGGTVDQANAFDWSDGMLVLSMTTGQKLRDVVISIAAEV